jgi:hypothetical protein
VEAAVPAPELPSSSQYVVLPGRTTALLLQFLARAVKENEPPLFSGETSSIDLMRSQGFHTARSHRFFPLRPVRKDNIAAELVKSDDMAGFVNHRLASICF